MGWLRRTAEIGMERSPVRPLARDESVRVGASMNRMNRDEKPLYHERGLTRRLLSQGRGQVGLASGKAPARSDAAVHARPRQVAPRNTSGRPQTGQPSCRERVGKYVLRTVV